MRSKWFLALFLLMVLLTEFVFGTSLYSLAFIVVMAFGQNVAYSLQSRSRLRSSNAYHAIAAITAGFVFFATFRFLVRSDLPLLLLPAYIIGTVAGTLRGATLSMAIEKKIGAVIGEEADKTKSQLARFWPTIMLLLMLFVAQIFSIPYPVKIVTLIAVLAFLDNFAFSILSVTRNSDNYWFHFLAIIFQTLIKFASLKILVDAEMNWLLFIPQTTGAVIGSISGAMLAKKIAKLISASFDDHVKKGREIMIPLKPLLVGCSIFAIQLYYFGLLNIYSVILLLVATTGQNLSFSVVSRARQRNNIKYLAYSSVFSNGVWYFTAHLLVLNRLPNYMIVPYVVGCVVGSLIGQDISLRIEKIIGAVVDDFSSRRKLQTT